MRKIEGYKLKRIEDFSNGPKPRIPEGYQAPDPRNHMSNPTFHAFGSRVGKTTSPFMSEINQVVLHLNFKI